MADTLRPAGEVSGAPLVPVPDCTHRPPCPGCPRYGLAGIPRAARESLEHLARDTGAELASVVEGEALGYRHRARLMVRGRARSPKVGLFEAGSHRIVDIPRCHVHHPLLNRAAAVFKQVVRDLDIAPYQDAPHRGLIRAVQLVVERSSQTVQVVVVANSVDPPATNELTDALRTELGSQLHSLWWNGNPQRTNTILGEHWQRLMGPEATQEQIGGADVFFPPACFGQNHLDLSDELVATVHAHVPERTRVAEFYAGSGAIGLGLLARGHPIAFNELSGGGLRGLELGLAAQIAVRERATVHPGAAGDALDVLGDCDVAILDPPRKGLEPTLRQALANEPPDRVIYISCDSPSLSTDARALVDGGKLRLRRLLPFALFPFTEHIETVAIFEK